MPSIEGKSYGIYKESGTLKFYDGKITGLTNQSIMGKINEIEENVRLEITDNGNGTETTTLKEYTNIVAIEEKEYETLEKALEASKEGDTIRYLKNSTIEKQIIIEETKNVKIDLAGKTIKAFNNVTNKGVLEIIDTSEEGTGEILMNTGGTSNSYNVFITNEGTMTLTKGTIKINANYQDVIENKLGGELTIKGGKITSTSGSGGKDGIVNYGTLKIEEGTIDVTGMGIGNYDNGTLEMTGGTIKTVWNAIKTTSSNENSIKISGGSIEATGGDYSGILIEGTGNVEITGGTITGKNNGIFNKNGTLTVNGGTIIASGSYGRGIYNYYSTGTVTISGGEITSTGSYGSGIYNYYSTGTVTISGGEITSMGNYGINNNSSGTVIIKEEGENKTILKANANDGCAVGNGSGTIIIEGGTFEAGGKYYNYNDGGAGVIKNRGTGTIEIKGGTVEAIATDGYGIYNCSTGTIILGEKIEEGNTEDKPSTTTPSITGGSYGIYKTNGTFNFYDGIITGKIGQAIYGGVTKQEEGYDVIKEDNGNGTERATLKKQVIAKVLSINNEGYNTINEALKAAEETGNEQETIQIIRDGNITSTQESLVVNKNIVLDLNGCTLNINKENYITNQGTLEIIDTSEAEIGKFIMNAGGTDKDYNIFITNEGKMKLTKGTIIINANYQDVIENKSSGELIIKGTIIEGIEGSGKDGIKNYGALKVEEGTINVIGMGIGNYNNGTLYMTGGSIKTKCDSIYTTSSNGNSIKISGGSIEQYSYTKYSGIKSEGTGKIEITGGTIEGNNGINNQNAADVIIKGETTNIKYRVHGAGEWSIGVSGRGIINGSTGTVTVEGGTITGCNIGIYNNSTGTIKMIRGTITSTAHHNFGSGIYNNGAGTVTVEGGTITAIGSSGNGIYNNSTGTVAVEGGTITSTGSSGNGVYNNSTGTIIIGEKIAEGTNDLPNVEEPNIEGKSYGIYNASGILKLYDGKITGLTNQSIIGKINEIEKNVRLEITENGDGTETATLKPYTNIVAIEETEYKTLEEALEASREGDTIRYLENSTIAKPITIEKTKNVKIDLAGKTIRAFNDITNQGTLEITDTREEGTGQIVMNAGGRSNSYNIDISNEGKMTLTKGTIKINTNYQDVIENKLGGELTIKGGRITSTSGSGGKDGIVNYGTLKIEEGTIDVTGMGIGNYDNGTLEMTGGTIKTVWNAIKTTSSNENSIKISGGSIEATGGGYSGILSEGIGKIAIIGGEIKGYGYGINNQKVANIIVTEGTITSAGSTGIYNNSTGTVTINGGTITSTGSSGRGVINNSTGTVTVNGGTIMATGSSGYGIYNNSKGTVTVEGGTITSEKDHGIYNSSTGEITIGTKDRNVQNDIITITGGKNGLYLNNANGKANFYDGTIIGKEGAIYGEIAEYEEGYELNITENGTKATLKKKDVQADPEVTLNGITYEKIEGAIEAISKQENKTGTIILYRDIEKEAPIEIPTGCNITIIMSDSNESVHTISYQGEEKAIIINEGSTLNIQDLAKEKEEGLYALIENKNGVAIENKGALNIGTNDGVVEENTPQIQGKEVAIENEGVVYIYDGQIGEITGNGTVEDKRK